MNENESYLYGLLITDGNLSLAERNRGKVTLEVAERDKDIVEKLYSLIPKSSISARERSTNFSDSYSSVIFSNYQKDFRDKLISWGFPIKNKTENANTPKVDYEEIDYWRGVIDGDGSLGFIKDGSPYVSFVTKSEFLKQSYCNFLKQYYNIGKNVNRNKRDSVYNIVVKNEDAVTLAKDLYLSKENIIYLDRKYKKAKEIQSWTRTVPKASKRKSWDKEQDTYILTHSLEDSMKYLDRTKSSIQNRLYRLIGSKNVNISNK